MATVELCIDGAGMIRHDVSRDEVRELLEDPKALVWITVERARETLEELGSALGFHNLAIEDATNENERPKATVFTDHVFILLYSLSSGPDGMTQIPISFFVGENYLVTVTDEAPQALTSVAKRWRTMHTRIADKNPGTLAYALIDSIVDDYFPIVDSIGDRLEDLETALVERYEPGTQATIHGLRMDLLQVRRVIAPEREAINVLLRRDVPIFGSHTTD